MHSLSKVVPIFSLLSAVSLPWTLAQAQVPSQVCQTLLNNDHSDIDWYPLKPLPETVATNAVARQLDELEAIAASPNSFDSAIQQRLVKWLFEKPDPGPPDTGSPARMDELLKILPTSRKPQLTAILDRLANRIERLPSLSLRAEMTGKLADYYQQLEGTNRAAVFLNRALASALKSSNEQARTIRLTKLLDTVVELGQSKAIVSQLPQIEAALSRSTPTLSLARAYADTNQSQKALKIAESVSKNTPTWELNSDLIRLYLQLNRFDLANLYLKASPSDDDARYGRLVAAYDRAKQSAIADKLFKGGFDSWRRALYNDHFLDGYLKAGGNPDRLFTGLPTLEGVGVIDLRAKYSLRAAGEYRRRNQQDKAQRAIAQFVRVVASGNTQVDVDPILMAAISDGNRLEAKTAFEQLIARNAFTKVEPPINFAAQINALDTISPLVQRLPKTNERRIDLLQSLARAYAKQQQPNKAVSIAERIPRQSPGYSSAVDTLAQVATIFALSGQTTQAQMIFAKALNLSSSIKELDTRAEAYAAIARAYTNAGQTTEAETARQTAVKLAKALPTDSKIALVTVNYMLSSISQKFLGANQLEASWKTLQEISPAGDDYKMSNINNLVSTALALGNLSIAQQAVDLQYGYGPPRLFLDQATQLARTYLYRDRAEEAIKMLNRAVSVLNNQKKLNFDSLIPIVQLYAKAGRIDTARQLMTSANPIPPIYAPLWQELQQYVDCHTKRLHP